jgi:Protein of unknown function (DUF3465)
MKKLIPIVLLLGASYLGVKCGLIPVQGQRTVQTVSSTAKVSTVEFDRSDDSDTQIHGSGQVIKVLADDNDGSRHQRFLVRLASGQTLLVAHNIDLARRIDSLQTGDTVEFYGEYEWNPQGGVIHWTHRDPQGRHTAGWIKHNGRIYQ